MGIKARSSFALKDQLFHPGTVSLLGQGLSRAWPGFPRAQFEQRVLAGFPERELKQRIDWMVTVLEEFLPKDLAKAMDVLERALPPPLDPSKTDDDYGDLIWVVPGEYVAQHGCNEQHLAASLAFFRESTKRASAEWAIRPFLDKFPKQTLAFLTDCAGDDHYHVRRLASEGSRPLLPWGLRVTPPVSRSVGLLQRLHSDPTRFVTRSVANHLNDLSKTSPDVVLDTLARWRAQRAQDPEELRWMTRHALRTLKKAGHPRALKLLGYAENPQVAVFGVEAPTSVRIGERFTWRARLRSDATQVVHVALQIGFLRNNGTHGFKQFVVKDGELNAGTEEPVRKVVSFRPMTTRVLYPGQHHLAVLINGQPRDQRSFMLTE